MTTQDRPFLHFVVLSPNLIGNVDVTYHYPPDEKLAYESELREFCGPLLSRKTILKTNSMSAINGVTCYQLSDLERTDNSFVISLNSDQGLIYGVCVICSELNTQSISFCANKPRDPTRKTHLFSVLRCYCLLTNVPIFNTHFSILYSLLAYEKLLRLQLSSSSDSLNEYDSGEDEDTIKSDTPPKDSSIVIIEGYYNIALPERGETIHVKLCEDPVSCEVTITGKSTQDNIIEWVAPILFRMLPIHLLVEYYKAIFLEVPVIVYSELPGLLSAITLSAIPLLSPMTWQGPLICILPPSLIECMHSPGSYYSSPFSYTITVLNY